MLAIDLDPQASLTFSFFSVDEWRDEYATSKTIKSWYDAFIDHDTELNLKSLIAHPKRARYATGGRLDLVCSHLALINVDLELASRLMGGTERELRNNYLKVYSRLRQGLESLRTEGYDVVLIDCPPNFNIVTKTAIASCSYLLIPTKPDFLSTLGIEQLTKHVDEMVTSYNRYAGEAGHGWVPIAPSVLGVVFTMIQIYGAHPIQSQQQYIEQVRELGLPVLDTHIRENKSIYADAPEYGVPVTLKYGTGGTFRSVQAELESLTTEVSRSIGL